MKTTSRIYLNIICNVILQFSIVLSGLIIPNLIIHNYGSDVNGLITSINQLLSYITLLEAGTGAVIKAELYKPLANKDYGRLSDIYTATYKFYSKIGCVFLAYLFILAGVYNHISGCTFDWLFSATMVVILGANTCIQYFIGIINQTILQADQQLWFTSGIQIITLWLNVLATLMLVRNGESIQTVKLATCFIFAIRPVCYFAFAKQKYKIKIVKSYSTDVLKQRWDGFGHHIAYFIHTNTDVVLLTIFSNLSEVSVYSVYLMVVTGVRSFLSAIATAVEPYFGRLIAYNDYQIVKEKFKVYEFLYYLLSTIVFSATLVLIVPFVDIYTAGVTDANYHRVVFSFYMVVAELFYSIRSPYSMIVFAAGHFKQTRNGAFCEAGINILVSLVLVRFMGIIGVAIGTVIAMVFRTTQYVFYLKKNILQLDIKIYLKRVFEIAISGGILYLLSSLINFSPTNYIQWIQLAVVVTLSSLVICGCVYSVFSPKDMKMLISVMRNGKDLRGLVN